MARRRMIDPNFWQSEDMAKLTLRQRMLFIGLFSNADDEGRLRGNAAFIRATIFPYEDFTIAEIESDLETIETVGLSIFRYEVDGNTYIQIKNWSKFQRVDKPRPSILPPPSNSKNNSENDSKNDSCLKEKKVNKKKVKEEEEEKKAIPVINPSSTSPLALVLFEGEFGRPLSPLEIEEITDLENRFGFELVKEALRRAVAQGKRNIKYTQRILENWESAGIKTISEISEYETKNTNKTKSLQVNSRSPDSQNLDVLLTSNSNVEIDEDSPFYKSD